MPGAQNPFDQIAGIDTVDPVAKGDFRSWAKQRTVQVIADANELRTFDLFGQLMVFLKSNGRTYKLDTTDTTTADDGDTCIRDFNGLAFKIVTINGVHGADVASAATLNLDTATGDVVDVTGTTTITRQSRFPKAIAGWCGLPAY